MKNLPTVNKNVYWIAAVFLAAILGTLFGIAYPSWYQSLPFKDNIPGFLKPAGFSLELDQNGQKVVRTVEESAVIDAVNKASPAVVSIVASTVSLDPAQGITKNPQGIGTGFVVQSDGVILTASHVVANRSINYKIVTKDEKTFPVKTINIDPSVDFAILKIDAKDLPTLSLADSESIQVGQKVVAIGNALGRFSNSVTVGVVSGIGRGVSPTDSSGISQGTLENVIQTDAALNPGNSGGPLLDLGGSVVGINFATTVGAENIGFVIPINSVKPSLEQFFSLGRIVRPFLGVSYATVDQTTSLLQDVPQGAFINDVAAGYPAAKAGLRSGDIVTKIGQYSLSGENTLASVIGRFKAGDEVGLEVWRDGKMVKTKTKLVEAPQ